ncbi:hypothetical protein AURDEDRAFT_159219 [Auricularia subglabra TFB-10046 SS5]|nr:hypothetical protein AURDEDRAFT_159219 [Auricularia subglabra TFB-10046 SS5]
MNLHTTLCSLAEHHDHGWPPPAPFLNLFLKSQTLPESRGPLRMCTASIIGDAKPPPKHRPRRRRPHPQQPLVSVYTLGDCKARQLFVFCARAFAARRHRVSIWPTSTRAGG